MTGTGVAPAVQMQGAVGAAVWIAGRRGGTAKARAAGRFRQRVGGGIMKKHCIGRPLSILPRRAQLRSSGGVCRIRTRAAPAGRLPPSSRAIPARKQEVAKLRFAAAADLP